MNETLEMLALLRSIDERQRQIVERLDVAIHALEAAKGPKMSGHMTTSSPLQPSLPEKALGSLRCALSPPGPSRVA